MVSNFDPKKLTLSEITKIQERVSKMFSIQTTLDQTVSFIKNNPDLVPAILGTSTKSETKTTKAPVLVKKQKPSKSMAKQPLNWKGFDFDRFLDGEVHIVTAQEIRDFFGWGKTVKTSVVLTRFGARLGVQAMKNGVKLRQKRIRTGPLADIAGEYQMY